MLSIPNTDFKLNFQNSWFVFLLDLSAAESFISGFIHKSSFYFSCGYFFSQWVKWPLKIQQYLVWETQTRTESREVFLLLHQEDLATWWWSETRLCTSHLVPADAWLLAHVALATRPLSELLSLPIHSLPEAVIPHGPAFSQAAVVGELLSHLLPPWSLSYCTHEAWTNTCFPAQFSPWDLSAGNGVQSKKRGGNFWVGGTPAASQGTGVTTKSKWS